MAHPRPLSVDRFTWGRPPVFLPEVGPQGRVSSFSCPPDYGAAPDFRVVFDRHWQKAAAFMEENASWMDAAAREAGVDPHLAAAVVFPELVRYDALRNRMEITLLKALYVHYGDEYADFSVGRFQIKPSCAEAVLRELHKHGPRELDLRFHRLHRGLKEKEKREAILSELEDSRSQYQYVLAILRILDHRFPQLSSLEPLSRLRFYATAFNSGFMHSEVQILRQMEVAAFHTGVIRPRECYSYAAVAAAWYSATNARLQIGNTH